MNALVLGLGELQLSRAQAVIAFAGQPSDGHVGRHGEAGGEVGDARPVHAVDGPTCLDAVRIALLGDLRQREVDLLARRQVALVPKDIVQVISLDDDDRLASSICADVHHDDRGRILVPLDAPVDMPALALTSGLGLDDRVRVLTELVRLFGYAVCRGGLSDGVLGVAVGNLCMLVRLLGAAIREYREDQTDEADSQSADVERDHGRRIPDTDPVVSGIGGAR